MKTSKKRILAICASLLITFSCITANASDDPPKTLEEYCQTAPCRKNHSFKLKLEDGTYFEHSSELDPPAVQPAFILIFPGEELFIEATEGKDAPQDFKHVPENIHPEKTLVFKFTQSDDEKAGAGMFLNVHNPFSRDLRYHLAITPLGKEGLYKTSSCPVPAQMQAFEHWPYPVFQVAVADMHFLKKGDDMSCRE
ncbi:hypothetical protein [Candidatus Electrothrix sp.]|uniref:hypothetical protein n=1 Tax=Candidatus Electrothrix sp. TaxID=2170559 RepID=UPI0040566F93